MRVPNIGLAAVFFANRHPNAEIVAIEPEHQNFEILRKNVEPYSQIRPLEAALWGSNTNIAYCPTRVQEAMVSKTRETGEETIEQNITVKGLRLMP